MVQWANQLQQSSVRAATGKTTMLDEMFPGLSERGLLVTDVTDTTSQALHISFADKREELSDVIVNSWSHSQMVALMEDDDVKRQNETDGINIEYLEDRVVVDGGAAKLRDVQSFKFPVRTELRPFPTSYRVPTDKLSDKRFLRALTTKPPSDQIDRGSLIAFDGNSYNALQLRAVVKEVRLKDRYKIVLKVEQANTDGGRSAAVRRHAWDFCPRSRERRGATSLPWEEEQPYCIADVDE